MYYQSYYKVLKIKHVLVFNIIIPGIKVNVEVINIENIKMANMHGPMGRSLYYTINIPTEVILIMELEYCPVMNSAIFTSFVEPETCSINIEA